MPNTYTQVLIQFVIVVKFWKSKIKPDFKDELYRYITGIVQNNGHKLIAINGMPDHLHILVGMKPMQSMADLMRDVKSCSTNWINESNYLNNKFQWQLGYGAFSYSNWDLQKLINYVRNQEEHHKKKTFKEEYIEMLAQNHIEYKPEYLFTDPE